MTGLFCSTSGRECAAGEQTGDRPDKERRKLKRSKHRGACTCAENAETARNLQTESRSISIRSVGFLPGGKLKPGPNARYSNWTSAFTVKMKSLNKELQRKSKNGKNRQWSWVDVTNRTNPTKKNKDYKIKKKKTFPKRSKVLLLTSQYINPPQGGVGE